MSNDASPYRVVEHAAQPYAYVSDADVWMGKFDVIADRFGEVFDWLGQRGLEPAGPVFFKYDVINMPGPLHVEAGVPIAVPVEGDGTVGDELPVEGGGSVRTGVLPAGRYVMVRHHGHPDSLMQATADLLAWAEAEGLEFDQEQTAEGHAWACRTEWYYSDPVEVPDLNDWETELAFKLR
jgi:effector-binding domain-containing protein